MGGQCQRKYEMFLYAQEGGLKKCSTTCTFLLGTQAIIALFFNIQATDCAEAVVASNAGAERALKYIVA